ncbi:Ring-type e3 ubiquitin transferase [Thalictrum thalictroides]|nr:Ring-type e3 ubiquitin transferase [Thalictrum thalictroides]
MPLSELFHVAELQLSNTESYNSKISAIHLLERSLVPNPSNGSENPTCPLPVMKGLVSLIKDIAGAKPATKVLLALCLAETNRHVAVEARAVNEVVEALAELEGAAAERALAALELLCTIPEGAAEVRDHALGVPMMVQMMGKMNGRGKECAISVLSVIFGGGPGSREGVEPPDEVARAVVLALQGDCSARGRRKGAQLLKNLENGRLDLTEDGHHSN